ncbi:hypothetical protein QJS04_geneDACA019545 [Acorus gramineus]|uniref:Thioredoxin domain-containing protein n=1 Tax=Acorus gramineus TaxID=55184 RepID=A0AAV9ADX0_ACOGR|nr:hypothetical protein QJS04_geneDACA019545 [Acorus gramineus]
MRQKIKGRAGLESISGQAFPQTLGKSISNPSGPVKMKVVPASHLIQLKDKIAFMVDGNRVSLDDAVNLGAQGNPAYDILSQLLHQRSPSLKVKQTKISLIAKEVGFQLLSDDFDVKIIDSSTADTANDQPGHASQAELLSPDVQQSKISVQTAAEGTVDLNDGDLLTVGITALEDKKEPALVNDETSFQPTSDEKDSWEICSASVQEAMKDKQNVIESMEIGEDARLSKENDNQPATSNSELPFYVDQRSPTEPSLGNDNKENQSHQTDFSSVHDTCSHRATIDSCPSDAYEENEIPEDKIYPSSNELNDQQAKYNLFDGSFFFSDGGHRMLKALTANSKIPSVVILDPIRQQHYVFPEETDFSYTSLVSFIDRFLNGSLPPYQRSELSIVSPRVTLQPPFVNLDFHETDSIPRITANIFSDLVLGSVHCFQQNDMPGSHCQEADCAWKKDVMVLFSNNWCGFCQRMEVVVREVYRSIKGYYATMHESGTENRDSLLLEDNSVNVMQNEPPAIFLMDCILNDCGLLLKSIGQKEVYPSLILFPAERKDAISYQGNILVTDIIEFIGAHGRNSHHLSGNKGRFNFLRSSEIFLSICIHWMAYVSQL